MKLLEKLKTHFGIELETIEEKSFWIVAPAVVVLGLIAFSTAREYDTIIPSICMAIACFFVPIFLMILVLNFRNYHWAYPMLCITIGAVTVPFVFIYSGGFFSGTALVCVVATGITVLCYSPYLRLISFVLCLMSNTFAFFYVYRNGSPTPIVGTEVLFTMPDTVHPFYNDVIFCYYIGSFALFFVINFIVNDIRRYKLTQDTLQRFFDKEKRDEILRNVIDDSLTIHSEHKKATIVFADITNFTTITESLPADSILHFLNEFFECASDSIHSTNGIIDKFIGDCVMAYWLDNGEGNGVLSSVQSMLNLQKKMWEKSESIYSQYGTELNFSVGIAYGDVILGDFGAETMHDFTIIGDAVNTASRIESLAAGGEILISDAAANMVRDSVCLEQVESDYFFKGKNRPTDFYRIVGLESEGHHSDPIVNRCSEYEISVCGCRGSIPVSGLRFSEYGGDTSCYVVKKGDYAVVVDCGTGLRNAQEILQGCRNIDVLLTHVHYDHIIGLLMAQFPEDANVRFFGHFDAWDSGKNTLEAFMSHPYWPVQIRYTTTTNVDVAQEYPLAEDVTATFYPSDHPDNACVIKLICQDKKIVFLADCERADSLPDEISEGSDLLFYDGMYDENDPIDRTGWGHGTWQAAVRFIKSRSIKKLVITHHDPELGDHSLMLREAEACREDPHISFAKTGDVFRI